MVRPGGFHSLLTLAALSAAAGTIVYVLDLSFARPMLMAMAAWGLLSLPVGLLVGHYCALSDEPGR